MLLYSEYNTPRLTYIVDFINKELFDEPIRITTDADTFRRSAGPCINYGDREFSAAEFFIRRSALLFETDIRPQEIACFELNFYKAFFQTSGDFPFDIFAAAFYLLTRYEEYLPHELDDYGRYAYRQSLACRENFLQLPLVNIWLQDFKKALAAKFPTLSFRRPSFTFMPTYDIDMAYSYLHKGWKRNTGGLIRSLLKGQWSRVRERIDVLLKKRKDPFDCYEWLDSLHLYCRMRPVYFFLLAARQKGVDRNLNPLNPPFRDLVRYHAAGYQTGVHPSWQSADNTALLGAERQCLEKITGRKVVSSRQHFIRLTLPQTYRRLLDAGIEKDFSMGYGTVNGFRASVAASFAWFDLERDKPSGLIIYPFCFMDANAFYEQSLSPRQALEELMDYYRRIKRVNGLMITIWHNSFLGRDPQYKGWKEVYEVFLKEEVYWDM